MDARPIDFRVLNLARGVGGAYATRLLSDLGAQCSWWLWDDARPGDWPQSAAFRSHFEQRVECLNSTRIAKLASAGRPSPARQI